VLVRAESAADFAAIAAVVEAAFGRPQEARMVDAIRASADFVPDLSLVVEHEGEIVGHVVLSYVSLEDGTPLLELGPISVRPDRQGAGFGGMLVRAGLEAADARGEPLVLVLGEPAYYGRFGFRRASDIGITAPPDIPDEAWMAIPLAAYRPELRGRVVFSPALAGQE
jgi:putative acetyltransferase